MILVIKHGRSITWDAGLLEINRLNDLPEGTDGRPDVDTADPDYNELQGRHLALFREWWMDGRYSPIAFHNLGGYDVAEMETVYMDDPDATDFELALSEAVHALSQYGILTKLGFERREDWQPNETEDA